MKEIEEFQTSLVSCPLCGSRLVKLYNKRVRGVPQGRTQRPGAGEEVQQPWVQGLSMELLLRGSPEDSPAEEALRHRRDCRGGEAEIRGSPDP